MRMQTLVVIVQKGLERVRVHVRRGWKNEPVREVLLPALSMFGPMTRHSTRLTRELMGNTTVLTLTLQSQEFGHNRHSLKYHGQNFGGVCNQ